MADLKYLSGKNVYLCGSIHDCENAGMDWRDKITPVLKDKFNLIVSDPCKKTINGVGEVGDDKKLLKQLIKDKKFLEVKKIFFPIMKSDLRCVDLAHFIICNYRPKLKHVGTIHELVMANIEKKPILLYYPEEEIDDFNPWIVGLIKEHNFFTNWNDMINYLVEVDKGNFDSSFWY
jgi:hypothetical protein